jgi:hypothetical protein
VQQHVVPGTADAVVLRARRVVTTTIFSVMILFWVLAIVVSLNANSSAGNVIGAFAIFGCFILGTAVTWYFVARGRTRLEIRGDTIVWRMGPRRSSTLTRGAGDGAMLRIVPRYYHYGAFSPAQLALLGSGGVVGLAGIPLDKVTRACQARGWAFGDDKDKATGTIRHLLHAGQTVQAAQFIELYGTFAVASDDEPATSIDAAVFEDIGDRRFRVNRVNGRDAYLRAAREQRAFAACSDSEQERAQRLAVADRIEAKARG